jgi:short-subunit dehydrogenase
VANASKGTALITGASTGIGAVYADRLAHRGYDLVLVARNRARLEAVATRLGRETGRAIEVLPADLTIRSDLATIERRLAGDRAITVLVNNAGIALNGGLLENAAAEIERLIALNVTAPTLLAAAAGKAFAERKGGTIINIAPGYVETNIHKHMGITFEQYREALGNPDFMTADELAAIVLFCYQQPAHICIRDLVVAPTRTTF